MYQHCTPCWPHVHLILFFCGIWTWCLMVPKVFCWSQNYSPVILCYKNWGCVLNTWVCSMWFVIALGFCPISALGTYFQSHWYLRQRDFSMSWYPSPPHLFCAYHVIPIGNLSGVFCQKFNASYDSLSRQWFWGWNPISVRQPWSLE